MKQLVALITADWHLKADRAWKDRQLVGDQRFAVSEVLRVVKEREPPYIIMLGDMFDNVLQRANAIKLMRAFLDTMQQQERPVLFIQGQHDMSYPPVMSSLHKWPKHIHGKVVDLMGIAAYGIDYCYPGAWKKAAREIPQVKMLFTHQVWSDLLPNSKERVSIASVPHFLDIVSGDFHNSLSMEMQGRWFTSPGPIFLQAVNENPNKSVLLMYSDMSFEVVPIASRNVFQFTLACKADMENLQDCWEDHPAKIPQFGVPPDVATNIVWVRHDPALFTMHEIRRVIGGAVYLFYTVIKKEAVTIDGKVATGPQTLELIIRGKYGDIDDLARLRCDQAIRLLRTAEVGGNIDDEIGRVFEELCQHSEPVKKKKSSNLLMNV